MDSSLVPLALLAIGLGMGALLAAACYAGDLRRLTAFLRNRSPQGNARASAGTAPGVTALAEAINGELDRSAQAHIEALRHRREFQRDLAALSHDIRTPLTGAKGYLQLAAGEDDPLSRTRHLEAATRRIDATCELLDQLFAYTKSADPDLALDIEPLALKPVVEEALLGHYPAFEERGWEPSVMFENDAATVMADREALARILDNLVVNALRHGAAAPAVDVRREGREGGRVVLRVSNKVANPAAIDVDRLFERFYQADASRGRAGSGLGLSVAANLAHAMGMEIGAELEGDVLSVVLAMEAGR